jgi:electron transfer flavoprotein-quinone oxidoreductase
MPPLYADGFLVAGDAAQMVNPSHREGSNLAMAAGRLAGETVIAAKRTGDFSAKTLALYQKKIRDSFIFPDLYDHRDLEKFAEEHLSLLTEGPEILCQAALTYFGVDGRPKRDAQKAILKRIFRNKTIKNLVKSELSVSHVYQLIKMGLKAGLNFRKLLKE